MPLTAGARLGPYEILSPVGAGGMGEVYRARDTRLDRTVAIKVLPAQHSQDPEFRQRFDREARAISALSHPHICTLHDVGHQDGIDFLVMEYLEGETLAKRIARGPVPVEQVLRHGVEIAGALAQAHRHAIVHRDLKPGNIMLTKTGAKLLDFGLAKMLPASAAAGQTALPTRTSADATAKGAILGTFQYMAPEQLEGKEADARTDIFALGAVLYEMAAGRKAFQGQSQASLITAIMSAEPPPLATLEALQEQPHTAVLEHVIRKCLAKNPDDRWQSAQDVAAELEWIAEGRVQSPSPAVPRSTRREVLAWSFGGAASLAAAGLATVHLRERPPEAHAMRFQIPAPVKMTFEFGHVPQLSPDGRQLVFPGTTEGRELLWLRSLDSLAIRPLAGTDGATFPFWSPDSRLVGFFAGGKLKKIDVTSGVLQDLCEAGHGSGGSWNREGLILFSPGPGYPLRRLSAGGGEPAVSVDLDRSAATSEFHPQFLPDGRHFVYIGGPSAGAYVASLDSKQTRPLVPGTRDAIYAPPGFLLFQLQGALLAQPFDVRSLRLTGDPARLADSVSFFSASDNGLLAYRSAASSAVQLAWYNRDGKRLASVGEPGEYKEIALSPDEKRLAVEIGGSGGSISYLWLLELASGIFSRLTFQQADDPVWSPDGRQLVFSSMRTGVFDLYRKNLGGGEEALLFKSAEGKFPEEWASDGSFLIFISQDGKAFYRLPLAGERKPELLLRTEFDKDEPHLSPDGRWIAYGSNESGRWEVYAAAFPSFTETRQMSNAGGGRPTWRGDGRELFYLSLDGKMMALDVKVGSTLETGAPRVLFHTPIRVVDPRLDQYCVTRDGQRFLVGEPVEQGGEVITVVVNWAAGLKR